MSIETTLTNLRETGRKQQLQLAANELVCKGIRRLIVDIDPESPSRLLASALNNTGVKLDIETCAEGQTVLSAIGYGDTDSAAIVALQARGESETLPLEPTGENVLAAIASRGLVAAIPRLDMQVGGTDVIMGIVTARPKI